MSTMHGPGYRFTLRSLFALVTIVCVLLALFIPMVQTAREAARRVSCRNNLKQMGLGMHNFHNTFKYFPPGMTGDDTNQYGWFMYNVPFVESSSLYSDMQRSGMCLQSGGQVKDKNRKPASADKLTRELRVDANLASSAGEVYVKQKGWLTICPSSSLPLHDNDGYGASHYCGNAGTAFDDYGCGAFKGKSQNGVLLFANDNDWTEVVALRDIWDGTSFVMLIGEVGISQDVSRTKLSDGNFPIWAGGNNDGGCSAWNMGSCLRLCDKEFGINRRSGPESNLSFGGNHPDGINVALCDGSVRFMRNDTDPELWRRFGSRNDLQGVEDLRGVELSDE